MLTNVLNTIDSLRDENLQDLIGFLRIPSVSTNPDHTEDCRVCANFLASHLTKIGLHAEILPTGGHPVVLAKNDPVAGRPTVLVYGHYDVQPPEPLDQWNSPPFEPSVRNKAIYARGTCDDKGQVWCHVGAIAAWQKQGGAPVNLIFLFEGEEEIGSHNLKSFVQKYKDQLKADVAVISDTNQFSRGLPAITYGLRGLVYMELALTGPSHDLHSGLYGGAVPNPANVLTRILSSLHDEATGKVTIPGFYDDVLDLSAVEREAWKKLPWDEAAFCKELGIPHGNGEAGFTTIERKWARPTLDINGLTAGYQGKGAKTVIASLATAKVSMRLVPNQEPAKIAAAFEKAVRAILPDNCKLEVSLHSSSGPVLVPVSGPAMQAAIRATETGFGIKPALMREGGSIPVVLLLKQQLNLDTLMVGFGLDDDRIHSPNEKFELEAFHNGMRTCAALYHELSKL